MSKMNLEYLNPYLDKKALYKMLTSALKNVRESHKNYRYYWRLEVKRIIKLIREK